MTKQTIETSRVEQINRLKLARFAVSMYFLLGGGALTLWAVHIPLIEQRVGVSYAELGLLLVLSGFGGFSALQLSGWIIDHVGSKTATRLGGVAVGLALILPGYATTPAVLGLAIFLLGFGLAAVDVPMNAAALEVEKAYGKTIFSAFHAFWSIGGFVGAALGSLYISLELDIQESLPTTGVIAAAIGWLLAHWLLPDSASSAKTQTSEERRSSGKSNRRVWGFIALAAAMAASGAIIEGTANDWSALYLRDVLGTSTAFAAWGLASFALFMTIGRFYVDRIVDRVGREPVVRVGALASAVVTVGLMFAGNEWLALALWGLLGLSMAGVVPQIFAMAGSIGEPSHQGRNLAKVVGITYLGALAGPSVIGILTIWLPLNLALVFAAALGAFIALASKPLERLPR
jgi:MFS family permease